MVASTEGACLKDQLTLPAFTQGKVPGYQTLFVDRSWHIFFRISSAVGSSLAQWLVERPVSANLSEPCERWLVWCGTNSQDHLFPCELNVKRAVST